MLEISIDAQYDIFSMNFLVSLCGMATLLGIAWLLCKDRSAIRWRTVGGAFLIQAALGALVLYLPIGIRMLEGLSNVVQGVIQCGNEGIQFMFGVLATDAMIAQFGGTGFIFAFRVLPTIIFFSSLIAVLYHLGVMPWAIRVVGGGLRQALGTSRTESLSASANIFVGMTEAPLVVRPYIPRMTQSELFAVMTGGLASIAGSVLASYSQIGVDLKYLLAASFMAAPGGLLFAKLMLPETETPSENPQADAAEDAEEAPVNVVDAAATGAATGLRLALNVGAMMLAFIGLVALVNAMTGTVGQWLGWEGLSLQRLLGVLFSPLAWLLGIPWHEALQGGSFIGQKLVLNEFIAYLEFVQVKDALSPRSQAIISFALCGFANVPSIAVLLGGLGGMAPSRRGDIARLGLRAIIAASLSNFMSACLAGLYLSFTPLT